MAALKRAPTFLKLLLIKGEVMFCTCVSHERDSRLAGRSSGYERKPLGFINFNAASVKVDGMFQFHDLRSNLPRGCIITR